MSNWFGTKMLLTEHPSHVGTFLENLDRRQFSVNEGSTKNLSYILGRFLGSRRDLNIFRFGHFGIRNLAPLSSDVIWLDGGEVAPPGGFCSRHRRFRSGTSFSLRKDGCFVRFRDVRIQFDPSFGLSNSSLGFSVKIFCNTFKIIKN